MPTLDPNSNLIELYDSIDVSELNNSYPKLYQNFSDFIKRNCGVTIFNNTAEHIDLKQPSLTLYENHSDNSIKIVQQFAERKITELSKIISQQEFRISDQERQITELHSKLESTYNLLVKHSPPYLVRSVSMVFWKIF